MVIHPPHPIQTHQFSVFLAGSIEMGKAIDWQQMIIDNFKEEKVIFYNPRRPDWDNSWKQDIKHPQFYKQVNWELEGQEKADLIVLYFAPNTKSPISLLELGLFAKTGKIVVCCPNGFWRKGNVDIVCERYNIPMVKDLTELVEVIQNKVEGRG